MGSGEDLYILRGIPSNTLAKKVQLWKGGEKEELAALRLHEDHHGICWTRRDPWVPFQVALIHIVREMLEQIFQAP